MTDYLTSEGVEFEEAQYRASSLLHERTGFLAASSALAVVTGRWGVLALRGAAALIAGYVLLVQPALALGTIATLLAVWLFVDAAAAFVTAISQRSWLVGLEGGLSIAIALLLLSRGTGAALTLLLLMAAWSILRGISELAFGVKLPRGAPGRLGVVVLGAASFAFGILLVGSSFVGMLQLGLWIGAYALMYGTIELALAFSVGARKRAAFLPSRHRAA